MGMTRVLLGRVLFVLCCKLKNQPCHVGTLLHAKHNEPYVRNEPRRQLATHVAAPICDTPIPPAIRSGLANPSLLDKDPATSSKSTMRLTLHLSDGPDHEGHLRVNLDFKFRTTRMAVSPSLRIRLPRSAFHGRLCQHVSFTA